MIQIASQPIAKSYVAHPLSRSFLLTYLCYILVLIIPATILINVNYSWSDYKRILINPTLSYEAYQISCINNQGSILYNSNFNEEVGQKNYIARLGVGIQNQKILITGSIFNNAIHSCSLQVYFRSKIGSSIEVLSHLPLNIVSPQDTLFLKTANIKGTISLKSSKIISQSSIIAINQSQFGTYPYSFSGNYKDSATKSISLDSKILYQNTNYQTSSGSFTFLAEFKILHGTYFQQSSLIDKLRVFIPNFMYLCLFLWWVIVEPLINWMLKNKVYNARIIQQKIKNQ